MPDNEWSLAGGVPEGTPSGTITIRWWDIGDEQEPNLRLQVTPDQPIDADRLAMLLRAVAERHSRPKPN